MTQNGAVEDGLEEQQDLLSSGLHTTTTPPVDARQWNKLSVSGRLCGGLSGMELVRVSWLSCILLFLMMTFWLMCSLKDPIMSAISGVENIPLAKFASLGVVLGAVMAYNKLMEFVPRHQLFTIVGVFYGVLFCVIAALLTHPELGLHNTIPHRHRFLGWLSYVAIESFGSVMVQCYWAMVNSSVDVKFAKNNFGYIVAGAQVGSILGPTLATQAETLGVATLYVIGTGLIMLTVGLMSMYIRRFGVAAHCSAPAFSEQAAMGRASVAAETTGGQDRKAKGGAGVMEGLTLFLDHNYVKAICAVSSLHLIQLSVFDYLMKVLAQSRYQGMYPSDPHRAMQAFAGFMGHFGQATNTLSLVFSLCGTGTILQRCGLTATLTLFPVLMLVCTQVVWARPSLTVMFVVMMVIKGMNFALLNPTKEVLYQMTASNIQYKCRSWIDTFGMRGAKAVGAVITGYLAHSQADLVTYGSVVGVVTSTVLIWCATYLGKKFEALVSSGKKVGDTAKESATTV